MAQKPDAFIKVCPSRDIIARLSDKWAMLILALLEEAPLRFGELKRHIEGISQKVLTQNLRSLERDGLITRTVYNEMPLRVEYQATEFSTELTNIIRAVKKWSEENIDIILENNQQYDRSQLDQ